MLHPRLPYLFKDTIVLSLTLTEFLQASDDSFRLKLLELDRNYDILTYCLQNNRSAPELIQHIIFCGFQSIFLPLTGKNRTSFTTSITLNTSVHRERLIEWDLHPDK